MKNLFILGAFLSATLNFAQQNPTFKNDTLTTSTGFKVYEGLELKIGTGAMNDGDFKFIRTNANSMFRYSSTTGYQGLANQANSFRRDNSGLVYKVKSIMPRGSKKNGYVYYAKIGRGMINYEVDLENAISSGEIVVPEEFMPKSKTATTTLVQTETKYDKLKKIKDLKDAEVLSEEEFQKEKAKILAE